MSDNQEVELLPVIQADRNAAANAVLAYRDQKNGNWQQRIRDGHCDDGEMVQAFARHRLSTTPASAGVLVEAAKALMARWPTDQHEGSPLYDEARALRQALSATATPASDGESDNSELIAGVRRALQNPDGEHDGWTDAGLKHVFFRWPAIVHAINAALATPTPDRFGEGYRAGVEASAKVAECAFDDRGRSRVGHPSQMDWEDGYRDATRAAATAIRALQPGAGEGA